MRRSPSIRRSGFTLIELMVVVGIIVVLAGLLLSAIGKFQRVGPQVQTRADIGQLGLSVENFKSTYQVDYIPSALYLSSSYLPPYPMPANQDEINANLAVADSLNYLKKIWPKASWTTGGPVPPGTSIPLDGNQVLTFLLGGVPPGDSRFPPAAWMGNRSGFLNSNANPFNKNAMGICSAPPAGTDQNKGPFFDFKADRIDQYGHYKDVYGTPYYYFSSRKGNDYGYFGIYYLVCNSTLDPNGFNKSGGYAQMVPFIGTDGKYVNPNGFQIISAGYNKLPGPGGTYDPGIGEYGPAASGGDDMSNFHKGLLGSE